MLMLTIVLVFLGTVVKLHKTYDLDANGYYPSAIKYNGTYYVSVRANGYNSDLYSSRDLKLWIGPVTLFNQNNIPHWASTVDVGSLFASEDGDIRFYYSATPEHFQVGAAFAKTPPGPYYSLDKPILQESNLVQPFVLEDDGNFVLYNSNYNTSALEARLLTSDGLSLSNSSVYSVITTRDGTAYPKVFKASDNYYLYFYTGTCSVKVAQAKNPLGPFTVSPNPIMAVAYPPTIVKSIDDFSYVAIYQVCNSRYIAVADVEFDGAGWPSFNYTKSIQSPSTQSTLEPLLNNLLADKINEDDT